MHLRCRLAIPLAALSLALAISPALAAKTAPVPVPIPGAIPLQINSTSAQCALGQPPSGQLTAYEWFFPSNDYYYTFFDPNACQCPQVMGLTAHWLLLWNVPCTIHVQVWIVPAVLASPGCYVPGGGITPPDPSSALCNSEIVTLDGSAGGLIDHEVPLPAACDCLNGPFFVLFKIVDAGCPIDPDESAGGALLSPSIVVDHTLAFCTSYNAYPGSAGPKDMSTFGFPGNTSMYVTADCCGVVPTLPGTWGKVKTLYR